MLKQGCSACGSSRSVSLPSRFKFPKMPSRTSPAGFRPLDDTILFKPLQLGALQLEHRVMMAPLTRMRGEKEVDGVYVPGDLSVEYYSQRASKGGFLLTEATSISRLVRTQALIRRPGSSVADHSASPADILESQESSPPARSRGGRRSQMRSIPKEDSYFVKFGTLVGRLYPHFWMGANPSVRATFRSAARLWMGQSIPTLLPDR